METIFGNKNTLRKISLLAIVSIFLVALPVVMTYSSNVAYATTIAPANNVDTILLPSVSGLLYEVNPTLTVNELAVSTLLGQPLPNYLKLSLQASYNGGAPFDFASCVVRPVLSLVAVCSFQVPWKGWGRYVLLGNIYSAQGVLLAQTTIDPKIEPAW